MNFSERTRLLKPSPTLALSQKAKTLAAAGNPVLNLTVGEPDWDVPASAVAGAQSALNEKFSRYTPASGLPELKKLVAELTSRETKTQFLESQVAITPGAKFAIYSLFQLLINPGDEVIVPAPYWVSYPSMAELAGGIPVFIETKEENRFKITAEQLQQTITAKTKAFILCSPSNPTGVAYTREELSALAKVLMQFPNLWIISDDIYNHLYFGEQFTAPHLLEVEPGLKNQLLIVNGASKTLAMVGWRIGWLVGPKTVMQLMGDYLSQTTSNTSNLSQRAALSALENQDYEVKSALQLLKAKKESAEANLRKIKDLKWVTPDGAFYFWINIRPFLNQTRPDGLNFKNSKDLAEALLEKAFVAAVPGVEFGTEGYLRISFAVSAEDFASACSRMNAFFRP